MTPDVLIRPERADHPGVRPLLAALDAYLGSLYAPEDNHILGEQALLAPDVHFLVAERGGALVGCAATRAMPAEPATGDQPYGEIKRMFVRPEQRGHRVAQGLLEALETHLRIGGRQWALLETGGQQREAVRLYERCGYRKRGPFGGYPDNGLSVFYEKRLNP